MEKLQFEVKISSAAEKVWDVLFGETTYPQWTAAFSEDSRIETDWKKGSKALFHDGKGNGIASEIAENIPNKFMSIKHLAEVKNGVIDHNSSENNGWSGAMENYTLKSEGNRTDLLIEMDTVADYKDYFLKTWPKALDKIKELAEKQ